MTAENAASPSHRTIALDRLSSPEQLDQLLEVTRLRSWIALAGLGLLLATAIAWSIFGSFSTLISAEGMLIRPGGLIDIYAPDAGTILTIDLTEGASVSKGEVVATIEQPDLSAQIQQVTADIERRRARLSPSGDASPERRAEEERLLAIDLQALQRLEAGRLVRSPYDGRILEIKVRAGDLVSRGSKLFSFQLTDENNKDLQAVLYVSAANGKNVTPGMRVEISPSTAAAEEYGYLLGTITYVSEFPATREGMMRVLANEDLVTSLSSQGPPFSVYAELATDPSWAGGYRWTSRKGGEVRVNSGTPCEAFIHVREQRFIELVLPAVRQLFGL